MDLAKPLSPLPECMAATLMPSSCISGDILPLATASANGRPRSSDNVVLYAALATELRGVRQLIEEMAEILVNDEHFVERYLNELQRFDLVVQCADESADLLDRLAGGLKAHDAVEEVRLSAVQARLRAALANS